MIILSDFTAEADTGASQPIPFSGWPWSFEDAETPVGDLARDFIIGANDGTNGSFYATPESFLEMVKTEGASYEARRTFD